MTWFRVDDKLHDHRKAAAAGKAAMGVWTLAGSWAGDNLMDGFIPARVLTRWGTRADAARLVAAGLWETAVRDGEKGWLFHEWEVHQPTRASVEERRAEARERMRTARSQGGRSSGSVRTNSESSSDEVTSTPSRPVPTHAAAAAEDAAAAAVLTGPLEVLRSKLQAHTPLQALRFDQLTPQRAADLEALIAVHGDDRLVTHALSTLRHPVPIHVGAFLGTWGSLPPPGQRLAVVKQRLCPTHSTPLSPSGTCSSCASDQKAAR